MKIVLLSTFLLFANPSFASCSPSKCDFYAYGDSTSMPSNNYDVKVTNGAQKGGDVFVESDVPANGRPSPQSLPLGLAYETAYTATVYFTDKNWNKLGEMDTLYFSPKKDNITSWSGYIDRLAISYQREPKDDNGKLIYFRLLGVYNVDNGLGNIQYLQRPGQNYWVQYDKNLFDVHF